MDITLFSFGFKHNYAKANMLWDVRFLPNPYWVPELRLYTGLDATVAHYVLNSVEAQTFLALQEPLLVFLLDAYTKQGVEALTLAIGCTGGQHRSVAVVEHLRSFIEQHGYMLSHYHRDIDKQ